MRKILALPRGGKRAGRDKRGEGEMEVEQILVIVEIPKGGRNKYEYDEGLGRFRLDRMLFSSVHYPSDYGYVEGTLAEDGDALDAMVVVGEATFPGCAIWAKPVGPLKMWDEKVLDDKVLCVPVGDPQWNWVDDVADVPEHLLLEIEHFFCIYKDLEMKKTRVAGWEEATRAWEVIEESQEAYAKENGKEVMLGWQRDRVKWNHWTNVHGVGRGSRSGCSLSRQTGRCPVFSRTLSKNRTPKRRLTLPLFPLYSRGSVSARI